MEGSENNLGMVVVGLCMVGALHSDSLGRAPTDKGRAAHPPLVPSSPHLCYAPPAVIGYHFLYLTSLHFPLSDLLILECSLLALHP